LAEVAPGSWAIEWVRVAAGEREAHAQELGIAPNLLPQVVDWVTQAFETDFMWPNVFSSLTAARSFRQRFIPSGVRLIGVGLPADLVDEFLGQAAPPPSPPGYAPNGASGVYQLIQARQVLAPGGEARGYEVLGLGMAGDFCSFRCNQLAADFEREFGATFNGWGLIDDPQVARRCAEFAGRPEVGTCADWWHPWHVQEYEC
jgi:hypothetical protein